MVCRKVPMEDGIELATDVYLPPGPGPFPTVLIRTPYQRIGAEGHAHRFVGRGYATVAQDVRGKHESDGVFAPGRHEAADGQATLDWVANQWWCNGRIGLWGLSYLGIVQVPAAAGGHEALRLILPGVNPASPFRDWGRLDGCFAPTLRWSFSQSLRTAPPLAHVSWEEVASQTTPEAMAEIVGVPTPPHLKQWAEHDTMDDYWAEIDQDLMHPKIRVPGFHIGGWFDHFARGQCIAYKNIRDQGATEEARSGQKLLMGPWAHHTIEPEGHEHTVCGDWEFGNEADLPIITAQLQALDFHLKEIDNGYTSQPAAKVFLMGENRWLSLPEWPPPDAVMTSWYLNSSGSANSRLGDGVLDTSPPDTNYSDTFTYDPKSPVPTNAGDDFHEWETFVGPHNIRPLVERPDVLYYRSPVLGEPLTVVGEVSLSLCVASSAVDTDFVVKLCVEQSDGRIISLSRGCKRCRYRNGYSETVSLVPGEETPLEIDLFPTTYVFPAGSRIGLTITSSEYPRIIPHDNTMNPPWSGAVPIVARNSVLHGPGTASRLVLPVLDIG